MGSDDLFKKRRQARKQRHYDFKTPKANSFLIVTEGERTEPLYFKGIQKLIKEKVGGIIDIKELPVIEIHGEGCSTGRLIEITDQIVKNAKIMYQNIWVVFDKDDFEDFDQAIKDGENRGYHIAWSNQAFEYWLYLHFNYSDSALHRHQWNDKLDELFRQYHLGDGKYRKNYEDIYHILNSFGGVETAIKNAKRKMAEYNLDKCRPSECDPGTMVYQLAEELKKYLEP